MKNIFTPVSRNIGTILAKPTGMLQPRERKGAVSQATQVNSRNQDSAKIKCVKTIQDILEQYRIDAFWDTPIVSIDPELHRDFIIERLLQYGGLAGIRWIFENWGADSIKEVVKRSRNLSRMTATFWCTYFDLSPETVRCLSEPTLSPLK